MKTKRETPHLTNLEQRIEALIGQMTLDEKVSLLSGRDVWHTVAIERLGVPSIAMTDGPHGVRTADPETGRLVGPTTAFPTGVSMAATWNPELVERVGAALGEETHAMGCDILLGPCVNIVRHPLAGRNFESYSEDPHLAGKIGAAWVRGVQGQGVGVSLKHFACNNQEFERLRGNSVIDERTLREIYLAQFEMIVKDADPWTVMCSYNRINGVYASQNAYLLREILKGEWKFPGVVVSDWGANHTIVESVKGGLDIEMPGPARYYGGMLSHAVQVWQIDEATIDDSVRRILRLIARTGHLERVGTAPEGLVNTLAHQALARELAEEAITLLKNQGGFLPLHGSSLHRIAVIGPNAVEMRITGCGSSQVEPPYRVNSLAALRHRLGEKVEIAYEPGCGYSDEYDPDAFQRAVDLARSAQVALVFLGMPEGYETEGWDRPDLELPGLQAELIQAVAQANPRTVVILNCGAPVAMDWIEMVPAALLAYYPGLEGGNAIASILLGEVNPSGKLPVTFPKRLEDTPSYLDYPGTKEVRYGEGLFVGYRYYDARDTDPLFPFGYGLSYTTFDYSPFQAPQEVNAGETIKVSLQVTNSGSCAGKETIQLYVRDIESSLRRPDKELKAFAKVLLAPGETKRVDFTLDERAFAFYDPYQQKWIVEPGEFKILAGASSKDIRSECKIRLV
jgi:beta-glucosidase